MKKIWLPLVALLPLVAFAAPKHLTEPPLSLTARALIHQKMVNHSKQMTDLVWAVVLLNYPQSAELAQAIAAEPRLGRPTSGDATELNSALPPRFFELQDELRTRAQHLETAARVRDPGATAKAYGQLAETCVSCHDAYISKR